MLPTAGVPYKFADTEGVLGALSNVLLEVATRTDSPPLFDTETLQAKFRPAPCWMMLLLIEMFAPWMPGKGLIELDPAGVPYSIRVSSISPDEEN